MREELLCQLKKSKKRVSELKRERKLNDIKIKELLNDPKVLEFNELLKSNNTINNKISSIDRENQITIHSNCVHPIAWYTSLTYCDYEGRGESEFICLECGERFTDYYSRNYKIIDSSKSFWELQSEYYELLNKYSACDALAIIYNSYNNERYKKLVNDGIKPIKALKILKIMEDE